MAEKKCDKIKTRGSSWILLPDAFFHILSVYKKIKTENGCALSPVFIFLDKKRTKLRRRIGALPCRTTAAVSREIKNQLAE